MIGDNRTRLEEQQSKEFIRAQRKLKEAAFKDLSQNKGFAKSLDNYRQFNEKKALNTALKTYNLAGFMKRNKLQEEILSSFFQTKPENVLKIGILGDAKSYRSEWIQDIALSTTQDAIYYIKNTYEQSLRGSTANQVAYTSALTDYAGEQQIVTIDGTGAGTTYDVTPAGIPLPAIPKQVRILVGGAYIGADTLGDGNIVNFLSTLLNTATPGDNFINYQTGEVKLKFTSAPNAPITMVYNWNSEYSANYAYFGTIGLDIDKTQFNARPYPLGFKISGMTNIMFDTMFDEDAEQLLVTKIGQELAKMKDYKTIRFLKQIALGNGYAEFDSNFSAYGETSKERWAQTILQKIGEVSDGIRDELKRGSINVILATTKTLNYLRLNKQWVAYDKADQSWGVYKAGTLAGIDVYWTPSDSQAASQGLLAQDEMLLVYKNKMDELDLGPVVGTLTEFSAQLTYPNASTEGNVFIVEDMRVVPGGSKFVKLLRVLGL